MKKRIRLKRILLLLLSIPLMMAGAENNRGYVFDLSDPARMHESAGTGGTAYRLAPWPDVYTSPYYNWENFALFQSPQSEKLMREWDTAHEQELIVGPLNKYLHEHCVYTGGLLSVLTQESGKYYRMASFDVQTGKRLWLSDLFYDGVNYIDYINRNLTLLKTESLAQSHMINYHIYDFMSGVFYDSGAKVSYELNDNYMKRPFQGMPNDYPFFFAADGKLRLYLDERNPYYDLKEIRTSNYGSFDFYLSVPLPHWLSPFGDCTADMYYEKQVFENTRIFWLPQVNVDGGRQKEASEKINEGIRGLYGQALKVCRETVPERMKQNTAPFYTAMKIRNGFFSIVFEDIENGSMEEEAVFAGGIFNMHTGEMLSFDGSAGAYLGWGDTLYVLLEGGDKMEQSAAQALAPYAFARE